MSLDDQIEKDPYFISSQWRAGHVLSNDDIKTLEAMYQEWSIEVDKGNEAFVQGYDQALREFGGEELVEAKQKDDAKRFDEIARKAFEKAGMKYKG